MPREQGPIQTSEGVLTMCLPGPLYPSVYGPTFLRKLRLLGRSSGATPASNFFSHTQSPC